MKKFPVNLSAVKTCLAIIGFTGILFWGTEIQADTIRVNTKGRTPSGEVTKVTRDAVTIVNRGGSEVKVPANQIVSIHFSKGPSKLARARDAAFSERFKDALEAIKELKEEVDASGLSGPLAADVAFIPAMAEAQLALRGGSKFDEADRKLDQFIKNYPDSYHYYSAIRLMGDLLAAAGKFDSAASYYAKLGKAPWPEYQAEAKILGASVLAEADKTSEARSLLKQAAAIGTLDTTQKVKLELAQAQCLVKENKPEQAIRLIEGQLKTLSPKDTALNAQAYNLLGRAYRRADQPRDAVLAFLHVDLLYGMDALAHAEALSNLAELWNQIHKPQRAQKASETLKQRYPFSRWNK